MIFEQSQFLELLSKHSLKNIWGVFCAVTIRPVDYFPNKAGEGKNQVAHLSANTIWIPRVIFGNSLTEVQIQNDGFCSIEILRRGEPKLHNENELHANEVFDGSSNPFIYKRIFNLDFSCDFELELYPVDYQECFIEVSNYYFSTVEAA